MSALRSLLRLLDLDTRRGRASFGLVVVLLVAFALSFVTDPPPLARGLLGAALVGLIVLWTLLAMAPGLGRER